MTALSRAAGIALGADMVTVGRLCLAGVVLVCGVTVACKDSPTSPNQLPVPVRVILTGQSFSATIAGQAVSMGGAIDVNLAPGDYEVVGVFSGALFSVAFGPATAAGGVRAGSLTVLDGSGEVPTGYAPWQDGCVAVWGSSGNQSLPFRLRFTVTTDSKTACFSA